MPKPPAPMTPYIRAWLDDKLDEPFHLLLKDYRDISRKSNTWNLTVMWSPDDSSTSTKISISWDIENLTASDYNSVKLYKEDETDSASNMLKEDSYEFDCSANTAYRFEIQCKNTKTESNTPFLPFSIIIIAIILISLSRRKETI